MITLNLRQLPDGRYAVDHRGIEVISWQVISATTLLSDLLRKASIPDTAWKLSWPDGRVHGAGASVHLIQTEDLGL